MVSHSFDRQNSTNQGFSTKIGLCRLQEEIETLLKTFEDRFSRESYLQHIRLAFVKRYDSPLGWFSILTTILSVIGLVVAEYFISSLILFLILCFDLFIVIRESNLRRTEIFRKTRKVLDEIRQAEENFCDDWDKDNYPHLCCPVSPCVSLQWTYRDNQIVNLPYALLVKGDHIVLRPGHITPGPCYEVGGKRKFKANETYGVPHLTDPPTKPVARNPLPNIVCCLENTPYLDNLKITLEDFLKRPPTIYNQQRYLLVTKYIQQWGVLSAFVVTFLVGVLRLHGWALTDKDNPHNSKWRHLLLVGPISAILPILPLVFPIMWISMNLWGVARLGAFLTLPKSKWPNGKGKKSFEEDLDTPTYDYEDVPIQRSNVFRNWLQLWKGDSELLGRSSNVVQVLGSITALCCVDKKGILSWPNPTAEKVFFLHGAEEQKSDVSQTSIDTESVDTSPCLDDKSNEIVAEVLDLTHDQHCPFRLEFDDHEWKHHINSLKPLGLAILLNTCSPKTHSHYAQFCSHVTALGMLDKDLVPVTNRYAMVESSLNSFLHGRCLCELAKQIGFTTHATDAFSLEGQLATYRHLQPDVVRHDIRFARQFQFSSKVKVPFPHSLSVVLKEFPSGSLSLFTQGTADIVLDCCDDFWDGKDLRPLSQQDRKRAQDFYQRNALTAYCTAFSYRPLRHGISGALSGSLTNNIAYLELPPESRCKMRNQNSVSSHNQTKLSHSISTDSLLFSESKDEEVAGVETCFEMQCHQVFIGMVTMQYQAQTDIVQLVECLERACIRFVHFSKENELRSRVFSEKMGLESGWNCHISLLSENSSSNPNSPKHSANVDLNVKIDSNETDDDKEMDKVETTDPLLLQPNLESSKTLSSSAPGAISNQDYNMMNVYPSDTSLNNIDAGDKEKQRASQDSALDEHCRSLSVTSESTEHSAAFRFDMSNRAKLPRGIENIRPHLEKVDNVPLQVSLFTDCSAEATREMLSIMQSYGEIVVCMGSSASNANAEIFLQADCSIGVEPLYPQVCQDVPAYNENNIHNNKLMHYHMKHNTGEKILQNPQESTEMLENGQLDGGLNGNTVSPIYISRILNNLPCSISVCRDDPLSFVSIIELSRRFSSGLWNCIQFWACCAVSLASLNIISACLSLPPIFPPNLLVYLMCVPVPLTAISLAHIEGDPQIMNRATGKKQTKYDTKVFGYVVWCYGSKFVTPNLILLLAYTAFMAHPLEIIDITDNFFINLNIARHTALFGIILHFAFISACFVHRDHTIWQKNPFSNKIWTFTVLVMLIMHALLFILQVTLDEDVYREIPTVWTNVVFVFVTTVISFTVTEICKWQEIKLNSRYQRRARLDFGTKLGMNSPF